MSLSLSTITFDCADPMRVAQFWSGATGRSVADGASASYASIEPGAHGPAMAFVAVPEGKTVKNRVHVDLSAADRVSEVARLIGLGASKLADHDEGGFQWTTLRDVEGNEFCVV